MVALLRRAMVDDLLDRVRLEVDSFPRMKYQPAPWLGKTRASRAEGVRSRWPQIKTVVEEADARRCLDVGAQTGFFSVSLARLGLQVVAVERDPGFYRTLMLAQSRLRLKNLSVYVSDLQEETLEGLAAADVVLFMSVFHHHVHFNGEDAARAVLQGLWERTQKVLFFESGEEEMVGHFVTPDFAGGASSYYEQLLAEVCSGGKVCTLGRHQAFDPAGRRCERQLYAVYREGI